MTVLTKREVWAKPRPWSEERESLDLTPEEQANVRAGLRWLRLRLGGYRELAKALRIKRTTVEHYGSGRTPGAAIAIRAARLAGVGVEELLSGRWPGGACPHCGRG